VRLFDEHPEVRERWQNRCATCWWTNTRTPTAPVPAAQAAGRARAAFTAVGDDDQAIYAWRGADVENLRCCSGLPQAQGHQARAELPLDARAS
jgi:ATP-dependent DNA helicase Rep